MRYPKLYPGTSRQNEYNHREEGKIMDALGGRCAECGTYQYLQIHHIKGHNLSPGRPFAERLRDWKEQLKAGNLILFCVECHKKITREAYG
jgi:5-methylcytosine-specific restriction endonuclease McrA